MPNELTFADPVTVPALKYAKVEIATDINDTRQRMLIVVTIYGDGGIRHPHRFDIEVGNGRLGKVEVVAEPSSTMDVLRMATDPLTEADHPDIANAFGLVANAWFQGGNTAILNELQRLGALPAGTAA